MAYDRNMALIKMTKNAAPFMNFNLIARDFFSNVGHGNRRCHVCLKVKPLGEFMPEGAVLYSQSVCICCLKARAKLSNMRVHGRIRDELVPLFSANIELKRMLKNIKEAKNGK